jgi:hypothetical protein
MNSWRPQVRHGGGRIRPAFRSLDAGYRCRSCLFVWLEAFQVQPARGAERWPLKSDLSAPVWAPSCSQGSFRVSTSGMVTLQGATGFPASKPRRCLAVVQEQSRISSCKRCSVERVPEKVISNWTPFCPKASRDVHCAGQFPMPAPGFNQSESHAASRSSWQAGS